MTNHIRIMSTRDVPPLLLKELRTIDPMVDLHYVGEGSWVLGSVKWTWPRYKEAFGLLATGNLRTRGAQRLAELGLHGFAKIASYFIVGEPDGRIVADFREREHRYRAGRERMFNEKLDAAEKGDRDKETKAMIDEIEAREADSYANFFKGRRSFYMGRNRVH